MKTIKVFPNNEPCLEIRTETIDGPNKGRNYGLHRDRFPDAGWGELRNTDLSYSKELELTGELRKILIEDIAFAYGNDTKKFSKKMNEFGLFD